MTCLLFFLLINNIILIFQLYDMRRTDITRYLRNTALGMAGIIVSEMVILITKDRQIAYFAFTFYYIAFAWYAMMIFRFSVSYSGYKLWKIYKTPYSGLRL